jgi:uncharacterized protein YqgV (UPF0045/DUF77 family)
MILMHEISWFNAIIKVIQKSSVKTQTSAEETKLPLYLQILFFLNNVNASYESQADNLIANVKIDGLYTEIPGK